MAMENSKQESGETQIPNLGVTATGATTPCSIGGKYCHQCRQKRTDVVGSCVAKKRSTTCLLKFCPMCLINRYGENAEEVALKTDWICPKCRGICNCSLCRKKRGQRPTGILVYQAKETGCSSVSELLETEGADKFFYKKKAKPEDAAVASSQNQGEENTVMDINNACGIETAAVKKGKKKEEDQLEEVKIPQGISSIPVSGIDLPPENAGDVFQFLEFCLAFGKTLDLKKGEAECVIREMLSGSQQHPMVIQMIIKLLTVILEDRGETSVCLSATDDSWFTAIRKYLVESEVQIDGFPAQMLQEYEKLDLKNRFKLLNFLCDETLGTSLIRNFIDDSFAKKQEAKDKLKAAKNKVNQHEQKLQHEFAKAVSESNGTLLSNEKWHAILSQTNDEEVHSEMLEASEMLSKVSKKSDDTHRTKPVELDENGFILWKLKSYNNEEPNLLLQDIGSWDEVCAHEKWFAFSSEQKPEIEKYLSFK
ncbi:hypothetical protein EUTSA_v10015379mg, partial [Eutrema salsugineum]